MNVLSLDRKVHIIACLVDGVSIRATARITASDKETVMKLGAAVGAGCVRLHDRMFRNLHVNRLELDEAWDFIGKKQKNVRDGDSLELGDVWTWIGLDAVNKAIVSFAVGQRDGEVANAFVADLRERIANRPQITSDGHTPYREAVERAFGTDVDFAMLIKTFGGVEGTDAARRYSPGRIINTTQVAVSGAPDPEFISTSYVERQNLNLRMNQRRFTRLSNGFSRKLENHRAAVGLYAAHTNLCRINGTIRTTPAMALGVTDHIWTIAELVTAALESPEPSTPPAEPPPKLPKFSKWSGVTGDRVPTGKHGMGKTKRPPSPFRLIPGGKK